MTLSRFIKSSQSIAYYTPHPCCSITIPVFMQIPKSWPQTQTCSTHPLLVRFQSACWGGEWKWKFKTDSKGLSSCPQCKPQPGGWQMGRLSGCYRTRKMTLQIYLLVSPGSAGLFAYRGVCKTQRDFHLLIDVRQANDLQPLEIKKVETLTTAQQIFGLYYEKRKKTFSGFLTSSMRAICKITFFFVWCDSQIESTNGVHKRHNVVKSPSVCVTSRERGVRKRNEPLMPNESLQGDLGYWRESCDQLESHALRMTSSCLLRPRGWQSSNYALPTPPFTSLQRLIMKRASSDG